MLSDAGSESRSVRRRGGFGEGAGGVGELLAVSGRAVSALELWELPAIGHFLCLAQTALHLPEIVFYELERCLLMPAAARSWLRSWQRSLSPAEEIRRPAPAADALQRVGEPAAAPRPELVQSGRPRRGATPGQVTLIHTALLIYSAFNMQCF